MTIKKLFSACGILTVLMIPFTMALFFSCEKVVEFPIEDQTPLVVVSSLPTADSTLLVHLSKSRFFLSDGPFPTVDDATVTIEVNGVRYPLTFQTQGNYTQALRIHEGDSLSLFVEVPGYGELTSTARVPKRPMIKDTAYYDTLLPGAYIPLENFRFTLCDPPEEENYYRIYMIETARLGSYDSVTDSWTYVRDSTYRVPFGIADSVLSQDLYTTQTVNFMAFYDQEADTLLPLGNFTGSEKVFSDKHIDGTEHATLFQRDVPLRFPDGLQPMSREFTLYVESITYDNYRYRVTESAASSIGSYFSEPLQVYTNIKPSGIGIFAAAAAVSYHFSK